MSTLFAEHNLDPARNSNINIHGRFSFFGKIFDKLTFAFIFRYIDKIVALIARTFVGSMSVRTSLTVVAYPVKSTLI